MVSTIANSWLAVNSAGCSYTPNVCECVNFHCIIKWIVDDTPFKISAHDTNGTIKKLFVSWNGDEIAEDSIVVQGHKPTLDTTINHSFTAAQAGENTVRVWAQDNDGLRSDHFTKKIFVRLGTPVIVSARPPVVWVNDDSTYQIEAFDTNGVIKWMWVDWGNDSTWNDSSAVTGNTATFIHAWDTTWGGKHAPYRVRVMDDDSLTATKVCSVFVRLGRPVVGGGATYGNSNVQWKADTLFYIYTGTKPTIVVDTTDSNGVIQEFYWDSYRDGIDHTTDVPYWSVILPPNMATPFRVTGKDDDGLQSLPFDFYVFPDAPPPVPTKFLVGTDSDSIILRWEKVMDAKDLGKTKVQIYVCYDPNTIPNIPLYSGTLPTIDSFREHTTGGGTLYNYHKFIPDNNNQGKDGKWMVVLMDERNSETTSPVQTFAAP